MAEEVSVTVVPYEYVDDLWPQASILLKRGVEESRGRYDLESLYSEIKMGDQHLWVMFEGDDDMLAAFATQFCQYPLKLQLSVTFCGSEDSVGSGDKWRHAIEAVMEFARIHGCSGIEIVGRKGWFKLFERLGFEQSYVTIEREV